MGDLLSGLAVILAISIALFALGLRAARRGSRGFACGLALLGVGVVLLHAFVLLDNPRMAWVLPFSNLFVVGNWSPLGVALLAGLAWGWAGSRLWRTGPLVAALAALCAWHSYGLLLEAPPRCGDVWLNGVCIQTTDASCSAASAATLLRAYGIPATEREMARLCLTRKWGTCNHGLYRGLMLKTAGTPYAVEVFSWTLDELRLKPPGPVLLHVRLEKGARVDPRYARDWGWEPGVTHAVVLFDFLGNSLVEMGDPGVGREEWHVESLKVLWHGTGIRFVKRR